MADLAHAIRDFQNGNLSHHDFFAQVDRALATEPANSDRLKKILSEEHTRFLLPPDIYAELQRRISSQVESRQAYGAEETRVQTRPRDSAPMGGGPPPSALWNQPAAGLDRVKGVGDTLNGRFVLEECIGFGGMGTVYKALDLRKLEASDRKPYIAIKVLNVQFRGHPKSLITLQREAKKAQTLAHPNIVTVYDFDRDGPMVYLTMEYLSGRSLSEILRAADFKGMHCPDALRIVGGISKALAYAHERGFVHCDLKPANVFVTDSGEVKVIDFGISRVFRKPEQDAEATVFDAGSLGGLTPAYASPEMLEHREPDPRDDIYALACITYELLTGRHPFDRLSAVHARGTGMKPHKPNNLGHRQWRGLRAGLSFDRATRTPTVNGFFQQLSGQGRASAYAAIGAASLAAILLAAGGIAYFWSSRTGVEDTPPVPVSASARTEPEAPPAPAPAPAPVAVAPVVPPPKPAPPPPPKLTLAAVTPVLAQVQCSALAPSVNGDAVEVQGYVGKGVGVAGLKSLLSAVPGVKTVKLEVEQINDDKCAVLGTLAPYWTAKREAGKGASIQTKGGKRELMEGDALVMDITTPGYESYANVDYYSFDGSVVHMLPSPRARNNLAPANYSATIGGGGNWIVTKPFGTDLIALIITPAPLFERMRPEAESASDYLKALEKQLAQQSAKHGADRIAVDFVQITTKARKP